MLCLCLDTYVTKRLPLAGPMNVGYDAEVYTAIYRVSDRGGTIYCSH